MRTSASMTCAGTKREHYPQWCCSDAAEAARQPPRQRQRRPQTGAGTAPRWLSGSAAAPHKNSQEPAESARGGAPSPRGRGTQSATAPRRPRGRVRRCSLRAAAYNLNQCPTRGASYKKDGRRGGGRWRGSARHSRLGLAARRRCRCRSCRRRGRRREPCRPRGAAHGAARRCFGGGSAGQRRRGSLRA